MEQTYKPWSKAYPINAFGCLCDGYVHETLMLEGELTHIVHFRHPATHSIHVTTRGA